MDTWAHWEACGKRSHYCCVTEGNPHSDRTIINDTNGFHGSCVGKLDTLRSHGHVNVDCCPSRWMKRITQFFFFFFVEAALNNCGGFFFDGGAAFFLNDGGLSRVLTIVAEGPPSLRLT